MVKLHENGVFVTKNKKIIEKGSPDFEILNKDSCKKNTISYDILSKHNTNPKDSSSLKIKFDKMASHDITYVGIIQTAKASGLTEFPIPYVLTNCHNSLCSVGGTINEDDHVFGLSACKKFGGIFVPPHLAVIHSYMREMMAACGDMILGSDSHTRYGALGTLAIGEGGGELAKQLLNQTYDIDYPEIIGVYLTGSLEDGVGPHDVALAIIREVFKNGFVKNKVMEFIGDGIKNLSVDVRNGIDVMTTETTCLSSIWETDELVSEYLTIHNREHDYKELKIKDTAYYDGLIYVDLNKIKPMIAMPFHPSNVFEIDYVNNNLEEVLSLSEKESLNYGQKIDLKSKIKDGKLYVQQGIIAGCSGGIYENIVAASEIIDGKLMGNDEFALSVYPDSQPNYLALLKNGVIEKLMASGVIIKTAFCGPCFGAGDVPSNGSLSIRHTTRNFPNRDGSRPGDNQTSAVALMDARSIAATAANGGVLTPATEKISNVPKFFFDSRIYESRIYNGYKNPNKSAELKNGPNIADWPNMINLTDNILLKVSAYIDDPVTTTDELIPSGETSSYRSNPLKLAEFTLSRKDPLYVNRSKAVYELEKKREAGQDIYSEETELTEIFKLLKSKGYEINSKNMTLGSSIFAIKPGDGSAREQAASCQKVLGGFANFSKEYATKRYRSNLINWGILPFTTNDYDKFSLDDYIFVPNIKKAIEEKLEDIKAYIVKNNELIEISLTLGQLTDKEREILLDGCLINYNKKNLS